MRKVLLVNSNTESAPYPVSPIGICMIATELKNAGYEVKLFDGLWNIHSMNKQINESSLASLLNNFQPDVIGVSIRNIDDMVMENSKQVQASTSLGRRQQRYKPISK